MATPNTGGLIMLKEMLTKLPPSERKIAQYILKEPDSAIYSTASELASNSGTSSAAVIRLCKSLGLKGFAELKIRISGDLQKPPMEERYRDIEPNESVGAIIDKMTNNSIQSLKETIDILNVKDIKKAAEAIINGRAIHFFGVGASNIIAQDAQRKFLRINHQATSFTDIHVAAMLVANATKDDVVIGISFSGETLEVAKIIELANKQGATTISITKYGTSSIAEKADINLFTCASKEAKYRSSATSSRLAQLHLIDILFMCVVSREHQKSIEYLDKTRNAIESLQLKVKK